MKTIPRPTHEKLSHLSPEKVEDLCNRYDDHEKIKDLLQDFKIDIHAGGLYRLLPPFTLNNTICPHCETSMWQNRASRTGWETSPYCPNCDHKLTEDCSCNSCVVERDMQIKLAQVDSIEILNLHYQIGENKVPIDLKVLSTIDKLYLSAFVRFSQDEESILNCGDQYLKLSPNHDFDQKIISCLLYKSYLKINSVDFPKPKHFSSTEYVEVIELTSLSYKLNIEVEGLSEDEIFNTLYYPDITEASKDELRLLWQKIAMEECIEYSLYNFKRLSLNWQISVKQRKHIEHVLNDFSVGQFFFFFYKSLERATLKLQSGEIYRQQCINYAMKGAVTYAERAIANKWEVKPYHRRNLEQSVISQLFFSIFLKIDQAGFYECPEKFESKA